MMLLALAVMGLVVLPGCAPRMMRHIGRAAVAGAVVTGAVAATAIAVHHAHHHTARCGHHRHWRQGRWVYEYDGHYEYYDHHHGRWYRYRAHHHHHHH